MALIIRMFNVLDLYFLNNESKYISSYMFNTIETEHLMALSKLVVDVDWAPITNDLCKFYLNI